MLPMDPRKTLGKEQIERTADYLSLGISKNPLGALVKQHDKLIGVNRDDRVLRDFQDALKPGPCSPYNIFGELALGNVCRDAACQERLPLLIAHEHAVLVNPPGRASRLDDAILDVVIGDVFAGDPACEAVHDARSVFGMDRFRPGTRVPVQIFNRQTPDSFKARATVQELLRLDANEPYDLRDRVGHPAKAFFALSQFLSHSFLIGDIHERADETGDDSVLMHRRTYPTYHSKLAVSPDDALLHIAAYAFRHHFIN